MIQSDHSSEKVRTLQRHGETWWVAEDICRVLDIPAPKEALANLNPSERSTLRGTDPDASSEIISPAGLHALILQSNRAEMALLKRAVSRSISCAFTFILLEEPIAV